MLEQTIRPSKQFNHTALYRDFLNRDEHIAKYIFHKTPNEVANRITETGIDRNSLCDIIENQNKDFNAKPKTFKSIEKLRNKDSLCIFSGQQPGLFGGPLLTLYKAVDIVKRAAKLENELGRPVVPIFWIACDDHDFDEINHTYYLARTGEIEKTSYEDHGDQPLPVAEICMSSRKHYDNLREESEKAFGGTDFSEELINRLFKAYSYDKCFVEAFARFMADIVPDIGLVFFCPHNKQIKTYSKEFFKHIAERFFKMSELLEENTDSLKNDGYHIQAKKKESAVHLFYHSPGRTPIHYQDDSFIVGEKTLSLSAMLDLIDKYPDRFSPDVLTRPVWQSFLFPVVAQAGGPSEIAYFFQIGKLFELFGLAQPFYYARAGATIVEKRQEELLGRLNIKLVDLAGDIEQLINRVAEESFPEEIDKKIKDFRSRLKEDYSSFAEVILKYEKNLEPIAGQTYGKIDFALNNFEKKIFAQHKKKMEAVRNQIYKLASALYPDRDLQERSLNINYYISKYGPGVVDYIVNALGVETDDHQMIYISGYTD